MRPGRHATQICTSGRRIWFRSVSLQARCPDATSKVGNPHREMTMFEADAGSVLAKTVVTVRGRASDGRVWDVVSVRLAAGVLRRALLRDKEAHVAFLESRPANAERMQGTDRWRGR